MKQVDRIIRKIQSVLTPDLLSPKHKRRVGDGDHPVKGHCYIAAEALWHLYGRQRGFMPCVIRISELEQGTHWFLRHPDGRILDPTGKQFVGWKPSYLEGRYCGFLTGKIPSKRTQIILSRIKAS